MFLRKWINRRRLKATMRPDPEFWERRLRALSPDRRKRVLDNRVLP